MKSQVQSDLTRIQRARKVFVLAMIAIIVAIVLIFAREVRAQDGGGDEVIIPAGPGRCSYLTPYGYWWFFWGCNIDPYDGVLLGLVAEETVYSQESNGAWRVEVRRVYLDGHVVTVSVLFLNGVPVTRDVSIEVGR